MQTKLPVQTDELKKAKKAKGRKGLAATLYKQHATTGAVSSGLGKRAAALPGRLAAEKLWDFQPSPKCDCGRLQNCAPVKTKGCSEHSVTPSTRPKIVLLAGG